MPQMRLVKSAIMKIPYLTWFYDFSLQMEAYLRLEHGEKVGGHIINIGFNLKLTLTTRMQMTLYHMIIRKAIKRGLTF